MPKYITIDYGESSDINHHYHPAFYFLLGVTTGIAILLLALYVNLKV